MLDPEREPRENASPSQPEDLPADGTPDQEISYYPSEYPLVAPPQEKSFPAWSAWDVATVLAFAAAAWMVLSGVALGVARIAMGQQHVPVKELADNPLVALAAQSVTELAILIFMIAWIGRHSRQEFWKAIHWNWRGGRVLGPLSGGVALALIVDFASRYLPMPKSLPVEKFFNEAATAYLMSALGVILAPLLEELFFRGLFYPLARRSVGVTPAVLLTATLFAFIHGAQLGYAWAPLLSIFVVGVVFTLVRQMTESVSASYLVHCGYNLALFGSLWVGTDHFRHLEKAIN
jgi:CAAX protease family protein